MTRDELNKQIDIWHENDEYQNIINAIDRLPEDEKDAAILGRQAAAYNNLENYTKAEEILLSIREEGKEKPYWHYSMGWCLVKGGRVREALPYLEKAVLLSPNNKDFRSFLEQCQRESDPQWRAPSVAEHMEEIETHMDKCFPGRETTVFHEILSDLIHLDVFIMKPIPEENFYVLYTIGMSALPMTLIGVDEEDTSSLRYGELMIFLPPDWRIDALNQKNTSEDDYWPLRPQYRALRCGASTYQRKPQRNPA